jgi:chromosomal replication initiator protein
VVALDRLRGRLSAENFETWFAHVRCDAYDGERLALRVPNRFYGDWIRAHYLDFLAEALREAASVTGSTGSPTLEVEWTVDPSLEPQLEPALARRAAERSPGANGAGLSGAPSAPIAPPDLNPKYRFESFIVGASNELAHAAAVAAASSPGRRYNPLFLYGGVGLGKTHLVNAVGHRVLADHPEVRILYVSAERFTNEFIWSLQNHRINEFRARYRTGCDVLLMDDIQFLASREQTQEEFFHTFNALYHSDKQIVVSSDASPDQVGKMQERLVSRFQCGMVADIQAPGLDTRVAILKKKAEQEGIPLADDVADFLAQSVRSNVRELEGSLLRLVMKADVNKRPIDLGFAMDTLRQATPPRDSAMTVEDIQRVVSEHFNIRLGDLKSHRRHRSIAQPRLIAMFLCRQRLHASYGEIGEQFGGKDHTTVMSAVRRIQGRAESDRELQTNLEQLRVKLDRR